MKIFYVFSNIFEILHTCILGQSTPVFHYSDVIMGTMASQITCLTMVYSTVYSGADQENIKALSHWPLCGEFTGNRWIPRTNGQQRGKCFHLMTSSRSWQILLHHVGCAAYQCERGPRTSLRLDLCTWAAFMVHAGGCIICEFFKISKIEGIMTTSAGI